MFIEFYFHIREPGLHGLKGITRNPGSICLVQPRIVAPKDPLLDRMAQEQTEEAQVAIEEPVGE
jgi:hypothetical protein